MRVPSGQASLCGSPAESLSEFPRGYPGLFRSLNYKEFCSTMATHAARRASSTNMAHYLRHTKIPTLMFRNARDQDEAQTRAWRFGPASFTNDDDANPVVEGRTRRNDCSQVTDGGAGVVLASARFAEQHARRHGMALDRLARISGWGHRNAGLRLLDKFERSRDDPYVFPHLRQAVQDAWQRAGVAGIDAMDGVETHDCFTTTEYVAIDHLGNQAVLLTGVVEDVRAIRGTASVTQQGDGSLISAADVRLLHRMSTLLNPQLHAVHIDLRVIRRHEVQVGTVAGKLRFAHESHLVRRGQHVL